MFNRDEQGPAPTFGDIVQARLSRRGVLRAGLVISAASALAAGPFKTVAAAAPIAAGQALQQALTFTPIPGDATDHITVPPGYQSRVVVAWGDPLSSPAHAAVFRV